MIFDDEEIPPVPTFKRRPYQVECQDAVREGWKEASKQLIVLAGGLGKTVLAAYIAKEEIENGGRVLFVAHTEELIDQAQDKFLRGAGVESDKEKASEFASPHAKCVVASVQTLARINRLTGFSDDHFTLVIVDEAHRGLSPSHLRVKNYFHHGAQSLVEGWEQPAEGVEYTHKAKVLGMTATPSRGDKRSLGEFYQRVAFEYGLREAVRDGYLVKPIVKNIPLKIDMRGVKTSRTNQGSDYDLSEVSRRMAAVIKEVAVQLAAVCHELKTVVFMPSIETSRMLAEELSMHGLNASFVSGACDDREEKIQAFRDAGTGAVLCNAQLVVEGFDVPDVTGVCVLRPSKIWSFVIQAWVRATRTLTGLIDHLDTKEDRLAAIATSAKPCFYIIDFLWLADKHDLIQPVDLVTTDPGVKKQMQGSIDLTEDVKVAERDFLKAVAKAAKKHERKAARVLDPLAWAVSLGDAKLASYEPETDRDARPPTPGQIALLQQHKIDMAKITCFGMASKIIGIILTRHTMKLATVGQLDFLHKLRVPDEEAATLSALEASHLIDKLKRERGWK